MQQNNHSEERTKDIEKQLDTLRKEYVERQEQYKMQNELTFDRESNCVCPTCEQELPEEKVEVAVAKFNNNKSNLLEKIQTRIGELDKKGPELASKLNEIKKESQEIQSSIDKITEQGTKKKDDIDKIEKKIEKAKPVVSPIEENEKYNGLLNEKQSIEKQIEQLDQSVYESVNVVRKEIEETKEKQSKLQLDLSKISQAKQTKTRINILESEQKDLAKQYESLEHVDYLINEFTNKKVQAIDEKVSQYFEITRFKMFEKQINGGLEELCEPTYKGVPFEAGLNDGAKVSVGIDIINVLSKHFGIEAPIFFDNAEQVTKFLVEPSAQMIAMYASEKDKELRIEKKSDKESEVA
jgi:chromosome segregation ATPase